MSRQYVESAHAACARRKEPADAHRTRTLAGALLAAAVVTVLTACGAGTPVRPSDGAAAAGADGRGAGEAVAAPPEAVAGYDAAVAAMRRGDAVEAELRFERLIEGWPELPGPYVNLAIL